MSLSDPGNISGALNFATLANPARAFYGGGAAAAGVSSIAGTENELTVTPASGVGAVSIALASPSPAPTAGSYTNANITVDVLGRVTAAANGSSSGGSIVGTDNQITATTAAGVTTLALAAPSPAPTAGSYTNANITVDALGRVTAAATGPGSGGVISTFAISGTLPDGAASGPSAGSSGPVVLIDGLVVGKKYRISIVLNIGIAAGTVSGWNAGGAYYFGFQNDLTKPKVAGSTLQVYYINEVLGSSLISSQQTGAGTLLATSYNAVIEATQVAHILYVNFANTTPITPAGSYTWPLTTGSPAFVQLQEI